MRRFNLLAVIVISIVAAGLFPYGDALLARDWGAEARAATTFNVSAGDVPGLIAAINAANATPGADTILAASGAFSSISSYGLGVNPRSVAIGDFDGDGALDMAAADGGIGGAGDLRVLRGTSAGAFTTAGSYYAGRVPVWVVTGDFDGDGALDLAATNSDGPVSTFSIFIGNGDLTFQPPAIYDIGVNPFGMCVDDFNGDGRPDIAIAFQTGDVAVLRGNGNGTFTQSARYTLGSGPIVTVASGDFNGDNVPDLVIANRGGNQANVFIGNGDATFGPPASYAVGLLPFAVAVADLDADGQADLAVTNSGSGTVSVLLGLGDGSFESETIYATGPGPTDTPQGLVAADLDGDGSTDLAVTNFASNSVATLGGNGDGTLQAPVLWAVGVGPYSLSVADVNNDGSPDLATPNFTSRTVTILITVQLDATPPVVSCGFTDGLWHTIDVSLACSASDADSGLANAGDASFSLATNVAIGVETGSALTGSHLVCDNAGNCTTAGPIGGQMIDRRAPTVSINAPMSAVYTLNQLVFANFTCNDAGSGVASCNGAVPNGNSIDTATLGLKSFSVTTTDAVGNTALSSVSYTVSLGGEFSSVTPASIWLGLKNSDDVGTNFDLLAEVLKNGAVVGSGQLNSIPGGSSGFNNAAQRAIGTALATPTSIGSGDTFAIRLSVRIATGVGGHRSGTARLWFGDAAANSRVNAVVNGVNRAFSLLNGGTLGVATGTGRSTSDVLVDRAVGGNPFKAFGTWTIVF